MKISILTLSVLLTAILISCTKENTTTGDKSVMYGRWAASYGDTILFEMKGGKNILTYHYSMNQAMPSLLEAEFSYENGGLKLKGGPYGTTDFKELTSFKWNIPGEEFEVEGIEWFTFLSSTQTFFTFKKIP